MSKHKEYQLGVRSDEYVAAALFISLRDNNIEYYDKQGIVSNIEIEAIITSIKKNFFHQRMMDF